MEKEEEEEEDGEEEGKEEEEGAGLRREGQRGVAEGGGRGRGQSR